MRNNVDTFFHASKWKDELILLRKIVVESGLTEEWKWKQPCYTINGGNVLIISGFKDYCCVSFFKGSLLNDVKKVLITPGENSRATRQIRFNSVQEIKKLTPTIKTYIKEAVQVETSGKKVDYSKDSEVQPPPEFVEFVKNNTRFKNAFEKLTPGRQRAYLLFFSGAKQSSTRRARIEKFKKRILDGYGMNDCVCGLSKRMPQCDGSHNKN